MYRHFFKPIFDFLLAFIMLVLLSPIMLIVAIAIKIDSKGPVLFKQLRTGKNGKTFNLYKFRSMSADNDIYNFKEGNHITKVGKLIRKTSIDELPQLINILKGEMSFIGPRPWVVDCAQYYTEEQKKRLNVRPGISGLAQVKGRKDASIIERIKWDVKYVEHLTFMMDVKVFFLTIKTVFSEEGAEVTNIGLKEELEELKNQNKDKVGDINE